MSTNAEPGSPLRADLVFEGGGVKGIGLTGAYRTLCDRGYQPECVAGTSAGAITAALVAVGYDGPELEQVVLHDMEFKKFEDESLLDHFGRAGDLAEFLKSRGMHSGKYFLGWMRERLEAKGKMKFGDLRDPNATSGEPPLPPAGDRVGPQRAQHARATARRRTAGTRSG